MSATLPELAPAESEHDRCSADGCAQPVPRCTGACDDDPVNEAEIEDDRRQRVELLLSLASGDPSVDVDLTGVPGDPAAVARSVEVGRLMRHVRALAGGPRHPWSELEQARAAANYVEQELRASSLEPQSLGVTHRGVTLPVVWTSVPGSGAVAAGERAPVRSAVVLVAHYDTVDQSPGADDNASGVAGLLEVARVLPRRTLPRDVVLAAVPFEEDPGGFAGSAAFAEHLTSVFGNGIVAAVSAEMLGCSAAPRVTGDTGKDLLLAGYPGTGPVIDLLLAAANAWSTGRVRGLAVPLHVPEIERSDHVSFHRQGIPAVMATDGAEFRNRHYHQPSDTPETLDPQFLAGSTQSLAVGLMALASWGHPSQADRRGA